MTGRGRWALAILFVAAATGAGAALAEVPKERIAKQYGISYMLLIVMQAERLLETKAKAIGLGDVTVDWIT